MYSPEFSLLFFICFRIMLRSVLALRPLAFAQQPCRLVTASTANTLKVKAEVKRKREAALLGGGQKRIDAQHKKGI